MQGLQLKVVVRDNSLIQLWGVTRYSLIIQSLIYYEDDYFEFEFDLPSVMRCPSMVPSLTLYSLCSLRDLLSSSAQSLDGYNKNILNEFK